MKSLSQLHLETDPLLQSVNAYKEIKAKIAFLESQLQEHKDAIESAASKTEDGKIVTEAYRVTLSIASRENFSLKNAKATLGEDALAPFISTSTYTRLLVN